MKIFGMGGLEIVIILVVILIIFGPKNLPKLGNAFGKTISNLRSGMNEGKKKKEEADAIDEADEGQETSEDPAIAQLDGEVEAAVEEPVDDAVEFVDVEEEPNADHSDDADASSAEVLDAQASADEAPRKVVRKVVRKKTVTEEVSE